MVCPVGIHKLAFVMPLNLFTIRTYDLEEYVNEGEGL
jgi:hypothetical protein